MQRYQPPHMRKNVPTPPIPNTKNKLGTNENPSFPTTTSTSSSINPTSKYRKPPTETPSTNSQRDWTKPSSNGRHINSAPLASPSQDLRPARKDFGARNGRSLEGRMEMLASVSRSGGDGAEGDALKDYITQEAFRRYVDERIDKHYSTFSTPRDTPPPGGASDELESLGSIVLLLRKLREGVVASHRIDGFAVEVFETSARIAILAKNTPQLISALGGLVPDLYRACDEKSKLNPTSNITNDTSKEETLADGVADLDINRNGAPASVLSGSRQHPKADNRLEFTSIMLLYYLTSSTSTTTFQPLLDDLTNPINRPLRSPFTNLITENHPIPTSISSRAPFISRSSLKTVTKASRSISPERFDPLTYFSLLQPVSGDENPLTRYESIVLSWAVESVRDRAWLVMKKAYVEVGVDWAGTFLGLEQGEVGSWVRGKGGRVEGGTVKLR